MMAEWYQEVDVQTYEYEIVNIKHFLTYSIDLWIPYNST